MKKGTRILKVFFALFLVVLISIESFAAVVSDNDGSAFITKAEFDSLKNDFQAQIDSYNSSIDNKIDSAIASYLSGVKIEVATTLSTVLSDWEDVVMRNYELANSYGVPGANVNLTYYATGSRNNDNYERYPSAYGLAILAKNTKGESKIKSVGLKDGEEKNYNDLSKNKFYWTGYITDYQEEISLSKLGYNTYQDVSSAMQSITLKVFDTIKLSTVENKYYSSVENFWNDIWKPLLQGYWKQPSEYNVNWNPTWTGGFSQWANEYKNDNIKNKYELTWAAIDENVINPAFKNCFYIFSDNTNTSKNMLDAMNVKKAGTWIKAAANAVIPNSASGTRTATTWNDTDEGAGKSWVRAYLESHYNPSELSAEVFDWTRGVTSGGEYAIPTLGGLGPISSDSIYLQKDDFVYTFKNSEYVKTVTTMNDGFPLIYAKKDAMLTWESVFKEVKGTTAIENNGEVKIILSYGEFGDESASKSKKYVQKDGTQGSAEFAFTTKDKSCKIKWTMQEDGWIYAKWFPAILNSDEAKSADNWYIILDGKKSNKVLYTDKS